MLAAALLGEDVGGLLLQHVSHLTGDLIGMVQLSTSSGCIFLGVALLSPVLQGPGDTGNFFGEHCSASVDDRCLLRGVPLVTGVALLFAGDFISRDFESVFGDSSSLTH